MLESIMEFFTSAVSEGLEFIINWFMGQLGTIGIGGIAEAFPILMQAYYIFRAIGLGLVFAIAIVNLIQYWGAPITSIRSTPVEIAIRAVLAAALVFVGGYIAMWIFDVGKLPYDAMLGLDSAQVSDSPFSGDAIQEAVATYSAANPEASETGAEVATGANMALSSIAAALITLIMLLCIGYQVLLIMIETCERMMMVVVLLYTGPLAYATVASKETSQTFKKWLSMFIGQTLLMTLSVWSLKAIVSGFTYRPGTDAGTYFIQFILVIALCKIAKRIDTYLQQLGLNTVTTGGGLAFELFAGVGAVAGAVKGVSRAANRSGVLGAGRERRAVGRQIMRQARQEGAGLIRDPEKHAAAKQYAKAVKTEMKRNPGMSGYQAKQAVANKMRAGSDIYRNSTGHQAANAAGAFLAASANENAFGGSLAHQAPAFDAKGSPIMKEDGTQQTYLRPSQAAQDMGISVKQDANGNHMFAGKNSVQTAAYIKAGEQQIAEGKITGKDAEDFKAMAGRSLKADPKAAAAYMADGAGMAAGGNDRQAVSAAETVATTGGYVDGAVKNSFSNVQSKTFDGAYVPGVGQMSGGSGWSADYQQVGADGKTQDMHMQVLDQTAYNNLSAVEKKNGGWTQHENADGSTSYVHTEAKTSGAPDPNDRSRYDASYGYTPFSNNSSASAGGGSDSPTAEVRTQEPILENNSGGDNAAAVSIGDVQSNAYDTSTGNETANSFTQRSTVQEINIPAGADTPPATHAETSAPHIEQGRTQQMYSSEPDAVQPEKTPSSTYAAPSGQSSYSYEQHGRQAEKSADVQQESVREPVRNTAQTASPFEQTRETHQDSVFESSSRSRASTPDLDTSKGTKQDSRQSRETERPQNQNKTDFPRQNGSYYNDDVSFDYFEDSMTSESSTAAQSASELPKTTKNTATKGNSSKNGAGRSGRQRHTKK